MEGARVEEAGQNCSQLKPSYNEVLKVFSLGAFKLSDNWDLFRTLGLCRCPSHKTKANNHEPEEFEVTVIEPLGINHPYVKDMPNLCTN